MSWRESSVEGVRLEAGYVPDFVCVNKMFREVVDEFDFCAEEELNFK